MRPSLLISGFLTLLLFAPVTAAADIDFVAIANDVRLNGCGALDGVEPPLVSKARLDEASRLTAGGQGLLSAAATAGYRARKTASIRIRNARDDETVAAILRRRFCEIVADPALEDIGVYTRGDDVWMLLAKPLAAPRPEDREQTLGQVLALINEARAERRRCGRRDLPAAEPLVRNTILEHAAATHAQDMAEHSFLGHEGSDGSMPAERVSNAGYDWRTVAENVAAGQPSAAEVVETWLDSPGHCAGLMSSKYSETGIAFVVDETSDDGIYWVQVFGSRD